MIAYIVFGYTREEESDDWSIYRAFTSRKEAEKEAIAISGQAFDEQKRLHEKWNFPEPQAECVYYDNKLSEIYDYANYTFIVRIREISID